MTVTRLIRSCSRGSVLLGALLGLSAYGSIAAASEFPSRVIRIIVPTAVSTPPDIISRFVATELSNSEGWSVIVENRPGALQSLGMGDVLKQPADGYWLLAMSTPITVTPILLPSAGLQPDKDFAPVIKLSTSYNVLVATPSLPVKSVSDLVALAKEKPGQLNFSSAGFGTPSHLIGEMFKLQTGARATHVAYQQFPQAIGDLLGGTSQYMFVAMLPVVDLIRSGKLHALAVTAPKRVPALENVPTVVEEGFPNLVVQDWAGFAVKAGTPADIVSTLNTAVNKVLSKQTTRDSFAKLGAEPAGGTPAEFGDLIKSQMVHWEGVMKQSAIKMSQ